MSEIFDWAKSVPMQPEPITVEIWKQLPEEFCRQVEVVGVSCAFMTAVFL